MNSICPQVAVASQPGQVNTAEVIAEAILSLPMFNKYNWCPMPPFCLRSMFCLMPAWCSCSCCLVEPRLYLTQSNIVFCAGSLKSYPAYTDFSIELLSIKCIKAIDREWYRYDCCRSEVRTYSNLIIQLKEDSSEKMFMKGNLSPFSCFKFEIDSFYHVCSNGDDFVQAVKQQIAALNIANE